MAVDSFRYLPRSFVPLYEGRSFPDTEPVWADPTGPIERATVGLLSSGGMYLAGVQKPFDLDRERSEPTWGDPSLRIIPSDVAQEDIEAAHLHYNTDLVESDFNVALPIRALRRLEAEGAIGSVATEHYSVMGYQEDGARVWREQTGPEIATRCRRAGIDVLVLAPS
jgi:D-proline reductase (dithiol) PrdB